MIGCGNMGSALVENLRKISTARELYVFDKDKSLLESHVMRFGVKRCDSIAEVKDNADILILAVKPQDIDGVLSELKNSRDKLIVSIAAGITLEFLGSALSGQVPVVRAMPNLNALIAKSVTAICANEAAGQKGLQLAQEIFLSVGSVVLVEDAQMNAVTAISGSGPAFVAYLYPAVAINDIERVLTAEAMRFGIDEKNALILSGSTTSGTLAMIDTNLDASMLIKRVCSKGGTTEAGMKVLEKNGKNEEALSEAIRAAEKRAQELSRR